MELFSGSVTEAALRSVMPEFVDDALERFERGFGRPAGRAEVESWRHSWPALTRILTNADLGDLHMLLEYHLPGTSERIDALLLGEREDGCLTAVVIELKQWTHARTDDMPAGLVEAGDRIVQHPARQIGSYAHYLTDWVSRDEVPLHVRGVAVLHNAPADLIGSLRAVAERGPSAAFPILGRDDLEPTLPGDALARALGCADLRPAAAKKIEVFLTAEHRPSAGLLARAGAVIKGSDRFLLIGDQDVARQCILAAVDDALESGTKQVIVVTGGPGTGKSVIACRLFGDLCTRPDANPRLLTPSGTLTRQLLRAVGEEEFHGVIDTFTDRRDIPVNANNVVLLDEAHRARTAPDVRREAGFFAPKLGKLINTASVTVVFLDERQIIRPNEGVTLAELERYAARNGMRLHHVSLTTQFRCNGSLAYLRWIDQLFYPTGSTPAWEGTDYDVAVASDPEQLTAWVETHVREGITARITAGFCWPWKATEELPLPLEVHIQWNGPNGPRNWARPWNYRSEEPNPRAPDVPARPFWATDVGGHNQVGCIYTAQGMEYPYNAVIIGPDLLRRNGQWTAQPQASHDAALKYASAPEYLRYALNTYRVLATRGTLGSRFYSTDPETQAYLQSLLPRHGG